MADKEKILLVDDEPDILEFIQYNLEQEGYDVYSSENGKQAIKDAKKIVPKLILLDVMMPEMDGIETCIELRKDNNLDKTVIAFLTARGEDYSQIAGLDAGADDYITKPIKPRVLVSRVKALLRRHNSGQEEESPVYEEINGLILDKERYIVKNKGEVLNLPRKEFELLALLLSKPGKVFTRDTIMNKIWGSDVVVGDRTIDVHIRKLREKIGSQSIQTIKGIGYKFDVE